MIIAGKDKGEVGYVAAVDPEEQRVIVLKENEENPDQPLPLNAAIKHRRARSTSEKSARIRIPAPLHVSNVMVLDPKTGEPSRLGRKLVDGALARYSKKTGDLLVEEKAGKS
jgi:large subunit ribosomal protein L24